jgi:hypothetical protein
LEVVGGVGARGWLFFSKMVVHVQFGVYGAAVMATLLFLVPRSSLSALIRIPIFAAFFV